MDEIIKAEAQEIVSSGQQQGWTADQVALLKRTYAKGATDDDMKLYALHCERTGLNPFNRQTYFRKQKGKDGPQLIFITAIDGYRSIADSTKLYAGNDDYIFDGNKTEFEHIDSGVGEKPTTATATVYKLVGGQRVAFRATTRWEEYYPGQAQGHVWRKMPYLMLGKCAEALALRKAFPAELGGIYTNEEMAKPQAEKQFQDSVTEQEIKKELPPIIDPGADASSNVEAPAFGSSFTIQAVGSEAYKVRGLLEDRGYYWTEKLSGETGSALTFTGLDRPQLDDHIKELGKLIDGIVIKAYSMETGELAYEN